MRYWLLHTGLLRLNPFVPKPPPQYLTAQLWPPSGKLRLTRAERERLIKPLDDLRSLAEGDPVALFRPGRGGGIMALGAIVESRCAAEDWGRVYKQVEFSDFLFDRPVTQAQMRKHPEFATFSFDSWPSYSRLRGAGLPLELTENRWEIISRLASADRPLRPAALRWRLEPGEVASRSDLHGEHGGDDRKTVFYSGATPDVIVIARTNSRTLAVDELGDDRLLLRLPVSQAEAVALHLRRGRALRLLYEVDAHGERLRYVGQFVLDQQAPFVASAEHPDTRGWVNLRVQPIGSTAALPGFLDVGAPYRAEDEGISEQQLRSLTGLERLRARSSAAHPVHSRLQNQLAAQLRAQGLEPLSPNPLDRKFDLAAQLPGGPLVIIEVKSLSLQQETDQLKKGLGQICFYATYYREREIEVQPVLYVERQPRSPRWERTCRDHGVVLAWPGIGDHVLSLIAAGETPCRQRRKIR